MLSDRSSAVICSAWQADIEVHLEADQTPVLQLGMEHQLLNSASGLMALQGLAATRFDITAPVAVAGGASPLWLTALMHGRTGEQPDGSPDIHAIFAGADAGTYMASRTLYAGGYEPLRPDAILRPPALLPPAMVHWLAPRSEVGANAPTETLAFYLSSRALQEHMDATLLTSPQSTLHPTGKQTIDWTAFTAIMLAVIMVLAAIVLSLQP